MIDQTAEGSLSAQGETLKNRVCEMVFFECFSTTALGGRLIMRQTQAQRMLMESCDVLIVGGGPAGSTCARILHRAGIKVIIMDKKHFHRSKVCAGWITPKSFLSSDDVSRFRA
jgi:threonine dehydrogenase-like Zn-dependent dehydrogenase